MICLFGGKYFGSRQGLIAGLAYALSPLVFGAGRQLTMDAVLSFWTAGALFAFFRGHTAVAKQAPAWFYAFWACCGFGVLTKGAPGIVGGTVIGSNIANVALILGISAVLRPFQSRRDLVVRELPLMLGALVLGSLAMLGGRVERWEGLALFVAILLYVAHTYMVSRRQPDLFEVDVPELPAGRSGRWWAWQVALLCLGIAGLTVGAELLVRGAMGTARAIGVPEFIIALTIVALGTSLPELATSVRAAFKGHPDIALGNIIGSNVFNTCCVLGLAALLRPLPMSDGWLLRDLGVMIGVSALSWVFMLLRPRLGRIEGAVLLLIYCVYIPVAFAG